VDRLSGTDDHNDYTLVMNSTLETLGSGNQLIHQLCSVMASNGALLALNH
jgi:hypothetical protein